MDNISHSLTNDTRDSNERERVCLEFIAEYEAGTHPTLEKYAAKYPQYADTLTDFILDYVTTENVLARQEATEPTPAEPSTVAVDAWERAMATLGISTNVPEVALSASLAKPLADERKDRKWTLGDLASRLNLPNSLVLKLERGQITAWPGTLGEKLRSRLATALSVTAEQAEAILQATGGNFRQSAAAYSAEGSPDVAQVNRNRQKTYSFDEALAAEHLTPEQKAFWS